MTSIVIWVNKNKEEFFPGLWAISDSRISDGRSQAPNSAGILTESYPKLSAVHAMAYSPTDVPRLNPRHVLSFGFAFAGSTLIGSTVREILSTLLLNLEEINYYDSPNLSFDQKTPSLKEVADLTERIASNYVASLGIHRPSSARIELAIFGHCTKSNALRAFRLRNNQESPAIIRSEELKVRERAVFVLGDRISAVEQAIFAKRALFHSDSLSWARAPISTLLEIIQDEDFRSIGGSVQLCATGRFGIRHIPLSMAGSWQNMFVGFDLLEGGAKIGGFSYNLPIGLTYPTTR